MSQDTFLCDVDGEQTFGLSFGSQQVGFHLESWSFGSKEPMLLSMHCKASPNDGKRGLWYGPDIHVVQSIHQQCKRGKLNFSILI